MAKRRRKGRKKQRPKSGFFKKPSRYKDGRFKRFPGGEKAQGSYRRFKGELSSRARTQVTTHAGGTTAVWKKVAGKWKKDRW